MQSKACGDLGEALVAGYYQQGGYQILATQYRTRHGEIDLIVQKDKTLVFVEVKTRGAMSIASPCEWVTMHKQRRIIMAAQEYYLQLTFEPLCRFDVVEVIINEDIQPKIHCIEDAFTL